MERNSKKRRRDGVFYLLLLSLLLLSFTACSEETVEEGEYDNWQARNEAMIDQWASAGYRKIKTYSKDASAAGKNSDYIYVEVLESGSGTETPYYTDTCRVAYRGHLIPTKSYADGYVFDQNYLNDFSWETAGATDFLVGNVVDGFSTALMNMHVGDRWRVRIPYNLGYGTTSKTSIPAYSDLVFEIALYDFWHPGEYRPAFRARQK